MLALVRRCTFSEKILETGGNHGESGQWRERFGRALGGYGRRGREDRAFGRAGQWAETPTGERRGLRRQESTDREPRRGARGGPLGRNTRRPYPGGTLRRSGPRKRSGCPRGSGPCRDGGRARGGRSAGRSDL